jgi:hypothetical protein
MTIEFGLIWLIEKNKVQKQEDNTAAPVPGTLLSATVSLPAFRLDFRIAIVGVHA